MKLSIRDTILNISVNLARISDWVLSENGSKNRRVDQFLKETELFVASIHTSDVSGKFIPTLLLFRKEFKKLLQERNAIDTYDWAERALTWANILQHRAKLA